MSWFSDLLGQSRDNDEDNDGQECCEQGSEGVVYTTVLVDFDELVNQPSHQVHPREGGGEGEPGNNRVEGLSFEFGGDERNGFFSGRHFLL